MVLHEMGNMDESLRVFLRCLAVDEDFLSAKRQVEKVRNKYNQRKQNINHVDLKLKFHLVQHTSFYQGGPR